MRKTLTKRLSIAIITLLFTIPLFIFTACKSNSSATNAKINQFYETVTQSQKCMDEVADDIYSNWYNAIYNDAFGGSINLAIYYAQTENSANLETIKSNDALIQNLYKSVRETSLSAEIKSVMNAYAEYYELVVNVSGSFQTYSKSKETLKKQLASALKSLALEI